MSTEDPDAPIGSIFDQRADPGDPFGGKANIYVALNAWCCWSMHIAAQQAMRPKHAQAPISATGARVEQIQREYGAFLMAAHLTMLPVVFAEKAIDSEDLGIRVHFVIGWAHVLTHSFGPDRDLDVEDPLFPLAFAMLLEKVMTYHAAFGKSDRVATALLWQILRGDRSAPMPDEFAIAMGQMCDGIRGGILEILQDVGFDFLWDYELLSSYAASVWSHPMFRPHAT